jgi:hypothetical protein
VIARMLFPSSSPSFLWMFFRGIEPIFPSITLPRPL